MNKYQIGAQSKVLENTWYVSRLEMDYKGKPKGSKVGLLLRYLPGKKVSLTILFDGKDWYEYLYSYDVDATLVVKPLINEDGAWVTVPEDIATKLSTAIQQLTSKSTTRLTINR